MNDPRITSYAVGELEAAEREAFEKELAENQDLATCMKETAALCDRLEQLVEPEAFFSGAERDALLSRCSENLKVARRRIVRRRVLTVAALGTLAACLVLAPFSPLTIYFGDRAPTLAGGSVPSPAPAPRVLADKPAAEAVREGEDFFQAGRYDLASKRFNQALASDPQNVAARRGLEKTQVPLQTYADASAMPLMASAGVTSGMPVATTAPMPAGDRLSRNAEIKVFSGGWGKGTGSRGRFVEEGAALPPAASFNIEAYDSVEPGRFLEAKGNPLSTFSVDVDTASYAIARRFIMQGSRPPRGAVRVEEFINYFPYELPKPSGNDPFSITTDAAPAPWNPDHQLVRVALQGRDLPPDARPQSNLIFLVDVSGSMRAEDKLPLLKKSLEALIERMGERDRIAIVVYAGASGLALAPTSEKTKVLSALRDLESGGSTNGGEGILLAYSTARDSFIEGGNNRVILCSDGDFNVGVTNQSELVDLIEKERDSGVFLSVLGFGSGNFKDSTMEKLADKGNGNYAYIDSLKEGRKVLGEQMAGTLFTIAKDVKVQVEFNPAHVAGYRLIGYENRTLAKEDFNDDKKDAGEIGAGHSVTAFYEVVPADKSLPGNGTVDPLKYQTSPASSAPVSSDMLTVKLRSKAPDGQASSLVERTLEADAVRPLSETPDSFRFAAAAAAFAMKLRDDPLFSMDWDAILRLARGALGNDPGGHRAEFLTLVERARSMDSP